MTINLHIERLVLDGVDITPHQRHLLRTDITTELTRMLNKGGLSGHFVNDVTLPRLSTNSIQLDSSKPMKLGQQIARSVYGGIGCE